MNITVIEIGYMGFPVGTFSSNITNKIICLDIDKK